MDMRTVWKMPNKYLHAGWRIQSRTSRSRRFAVCSQIKRAIFSNRISPNLKSIVYCNAIRYGAADEWDFAWEQYKKTNTASEKRQFLTALTCSKEPWILNRYKQPSMCIRETVNMEDVWIGYWNGL